MRVLLILPCPHGFNFVYRLAEEARVEGVHYVAEKLSGHVFDGIIRQVLN